MCKRIFLLLVLCFVASGLPAMEQDFSQQEKSAHGEETAASLFTVIIPNTQTVVSESSKVLLDMMHAVYVGKKKQSVFAEATLTESKRVLFNYIMDTRDTLTVLDFDNALQKLITECGPSWTDIYSDILQVIYFCKAECIKVLIKASPDKYRSFLMLNKTAFIKQFIQESFKFLEECFPFDAATRNDKKVLKDEILKKYRQLTDHGNLKIKKITNQLEICKVNLSFIKQHHLMSEILKGETNTDIIKNLQRLQDATIDMLNVINELRDKDFLGTYKRLSKYYTIIHRIISDMQLVIAQAKYDITSISIDAEVIALA